MKAMVKRIGSFLVALSLLLVCCPINAFANSTDLNEGEAPAEDRIYLGTWILSDEEEVAAPNKAPRYGEHTVSTIIATETHTTYVSPTGQPANGYCFPTGGAVYVNTSGSSNVSVSFGLAWGAYTVSVSVGSVSTGASAGGLVVNIPADNHFYKVQLAYNIKFNHVKVDEYKYQDLVHTYYVTNSQVQSVTAYAYKVS